MALQHSRKHKMIGGGVSGGIAECRGRDPTAVRVLYVVPEASAGPYSRTTAYCPSCILPLVLTGASKALFPIERSRTRP